MTMKNILNPFMMSVLLSIPSYLTTSIQAAKITIIIEYTIRRTISSPH